eukprot:1146468-Pelagomonas_calceolata.AAC.5
MWWQGGVVGRLLFHGALTLSRVQNIISTTVYDQHRACQLALNRTAAALHARTWCGKAMPVHARVHILAHRSCSSVRTPAPSP